MTGATGNVGSAVVRALAAAPQVDHTVGLARRHGGAAPTDRLTYVAADVRDREAIARAMDGIDAVIHLAWAIQPSRDRRHTEDVNVVGSERVFRAAAAAGVRTLVHASSVGVYSPTTDAAPHDETWPRDGIASSFYSRGKAQAEKLLDQVEAESPSLRVVRLRPALIFQRRAATEIRRLFAGPLLPGGLLRPSLLPVVPHVSAIRFQAVHADDVADAYRRAVVDDRARGAFNVAAEPIMTTRTVAGIFGARALPLPYRVARTAADLTWRAHLQPTPAGWLDLAAFAPIMDTGRVRDELGWKPAHDGEDTLRELLAGLRYGATGATPPLEGKPRLQEVLTGVGRT